MQQLINQVADIARKAGAAILDIYNTDFAQYEKSDSSPLTEADLAAHRIICDGLAAISEYPILSEESPAEDMAWSNRQNWQQFWLVDPLDGTKEFIKKNGEFTVNIALIRNGRAELGVVYCPALNRLYYSADNLGAWRVDGDNAPVQLKVQAEPTDGQKWAVVGSRSHGADALAAFSARLGDVDLVSMGSSLKLCLVAEGKAHLYPRLALTCEWDTGAAQAIVEHAGGKVLTPDLQPLRYGEKENLLNPYFIVCGAVNPLWSGAFTELAKSEAAKAGH